MAFMGLAYQTIQMFGLRDGSFLIASVAISKVRPNWGWHRKKLTAKGYSKPFYIRPGTSDRAIVRQVFINEEYDCQSDGHNAALRKYYDKIVATGETPLIIDCGANIGLASLWYAHTFPKAHIIAIEPQPENYQLLVANTTNYGNITTVQGAVSSRQTRVSLSNVGDQPWAWEVKETATGEIQTYTIEELSKICPNSRLMIVKIDIEGGEVDLFGANVDWVSDAPVIVFEAHDWLFNWGGTFHAVASVLTKQPRDYIQSGENTFSFAHAMMNNQTVRI